MNAAAAHAAGARAPGAHGNGRLESLDVLRGLAVLGILAVNAAYFAAPWQAAINPLLEPLAIDERTLWSWLVPHLFFEFKFITLFSLLFGASLFLVGGDGSEPERNRVLWRRLFWLGLIGALHGALIWSGDILLLYAVCGAIAAFGREWRARTLLSVGLALYALATFGMIGGGAALTMAPAANLAEIRAEIWVPAEAEIARVIAGFRAGFFSATRENFAEWLTFLQYTPLGMGPRTIALMLIGMALFKFGFLSGRSAAWVYWLFIVLGAAALGAVWAQAMENFALGFPFLHMQGRGLIANVALSPLITLFYMSALILLLRAGALKALTRALAAVGRMAFTNYLTQSLIMTTIFWGGRGFGFFGALDRPTLMALVPLVWAAQIVWSPLWLKHFRMGPLEWIWRRLSYARPVAITA